jgi:hypothetical protein
MQVMYSTGTQLVVYFKEPFAFDVGNTVGIAATGDLVGAFVGFIVGAFVAFLEAFVGCFVGAFVGCFVGAFVGCFVGAFVGCLTGDLVGDFVFFGAAGPLRSLSREI